MACGFLVLICGCYSYSFWLLTVVQYEFAAVIAFGVAFANWLVFWVGGLVLTGLLFLVYCEVVALF